MKTRVRNTVSAVSLFACAGLAQAQAFSQHFDDITTLTTTGWVMQNNSVAGGSQPTWFQGNATVFNAEQGGPSAYIAANYNNTTGTNTISNWLLTPAVTLHNGDTLSFWTRTVSTPAYADRLEVRLSTTGSGSNVGTLPDDAGDFTTVLQTVNPTLTTSGYPSAWTQYTVTLSGLTGTPTGRFAFRYYVPLGGPSGSNSDYIGIDEVNYTPAGVSTGACCNIDGTCAAGLTADACTSAGGSYAGNNTTCSAATCPTGSCCLPDGSCVANMSAAGCATQSGVYGGNGSACGSCPQPAAVLYNNGYAGAAPIPALGTFATGTPDQYGVAAPAYPLL
jgi:hypothetical protein